MTSNSSDTLFQPPAGGRTQETTAPQQEDSAQQAQKNAYSVSEISQAIKRTVEQGFSYVRIRGEISGFKRAASGHLYLDLKDEKSLINAVCWRGVASKLLCAPRDGLDVIVTGKVTTYPGRSNYQIVIEQMELAGIGALMQQLEELKQKLRSEGVFDAERKKPRPKMPQVIGVITSPTGAVIRDILHRIEDRFPVHVVVWPVKVQGDGAAQQIAEAIDGFNSREIENMREIIDDETGEVTEVVEKIRPDLLIVARGGGSLEDLWCFNEEIVVRAAYNSDIPIISAVGHETDTTLIDHAADLRAPTPTAAAEMAVPVRSDLLGYTTEAGLRLQRTIYRQIEEKKQLIAGLARGIPRPTDMLEYNMQRLDDISTRLNAAMQQNIKNRQQYIAILHSKIRPPSQHITQVQNNLQNLDVRMTNSIQSMLQRKNDHLNATIRTLGSLSYQNTLKRGFTLVRDDSGNAITSESALPHSGSAEIQFHDGSRKVKLD